LCSNKDDDQAQDVGVVASQKGGTARFILREDKHLAVLDSWERQKYSAYGWWDADLYPF